MNLTAIQGKTIFVDISVQIKNKLQPAKNRRRAPYSQKYIKLPAGTAEGTVSDRSGESGKETAVLSEFADGADMTMA